MKPMNHDSVNRSQNACSPETVKQLAESGLGRNQIAAQLQVTTYRVDKAAQAAGVTFDRSTTRKAVQARSVDAQAARAALSEQFQEVARLTLDRALETLTANDLDPVELRELVWVAGSAAASDVRLAKHALDVLQARNAQQTTDDRNDVVEALQIGMNQIMSMGDDELMALMETDT